MILYYSATGNTRFIAENLARLLNDTSLNLLPRIKKKDFSAIHSSKPFVICAPTYVSEMPRFLAAYLKRVPLTGSREVWFLFTSGGYAGCSGVLAEKLIQKKQMRFRGYAEFLMPGNYIADNHYPEPGEEEIVRRISNASKKLPEIAETIRTGGVLKHRHVWLFEKLVTIPFNPVWCRVKQTASPFFAGESCISCGRCARLCPVNAITIVNGKPLWTKEHCAHCMSCIQNCPVEAIEYGIITRNKKRYLLQKYRCKPEENQNER